MKKITEIELMNLAFGTKIKVVWEKNETYLRVIFGENIGYEDGKFDKTIIISESIHNNNCEVYLLN